MRNVHPQSWPIHQFRMGWAAYFAANNTFHANTYPLCDFVNLTVQKTEALVKVLIFEHALACHLVRHLPLQLHHQLQHLIIGLPRKQNLARVKLVDCAPHRPHVNSRIILVANN